MILCHGPIDKLLRILVDKRQAWLGDNSGGQLVVSASNLFGGESREGGVSGHVDFENGLPTQGQNGYLLSKLGSGVPSFRGVAGVVLRQCYLGVNPYLKKWAFMAQRVHTRQAGLTQWYDAKSEVPSGTIRGAFDSEYFDGVNSFSSNHPAGYEMSGSAVRNTMLQSFNGSYYRREVNSPGLYASKISFNFRILVAGTTGDACNIAITTASGVEWFNFNGRRSSGVDPLQRPSINNFYLGGTPIGTEALEVGELYYFEMVFDHDAHVGAFAIRHNNAVILSGGVAIPTGEPIYYIGMTRDGDASDWSQIEYSNVKLEGEVRYADMNPAHIIRECLTDPDWGMGYQESDIDDDSFQAAADTLHSENFGLSLLWDRQTAIEDFVKEVVRHIQASLYVDRTTGKFRLKLIRADYVEEDLLVLDESCVEKVENFTRPSFGDMINSVTVNYWDNSTASTASLSAQDTALVQMQGAVVGTTIQYPGCTNSGLASRLASRDLRLLSTPLLSCTVYANRKAAALNVGDPFVLDWPDYLDEPTVMRVIGLALGDGRSNKVKVTCTEDAFSFPDVAIVRPEAPTWDDPSGSPTAAQYRAVVEAPYFELVQRLGQTTTDEQLAANPGVGYLLGSAAAPGFSINARLAVDAGAGYETGNDTPMDFCPSAFLAADLAPGATSVAIHSGQALSSVVAGTHAQVGEELVKVVSVTDSLLTIGRGVLDTVPAAHLSGSVVLFWDAFADSDGVEYVDGETVAVRMLPVSGSDALNLAEAPEDSLTFSSRAYRPYPPGNVKVNGAPYPSTIGSSSSLSLSWSHRDRVQQTAGDIVDTTAGNIGPEAGTTYELGIYGESGSLLRSYAGLTGTSQEYSTADELSDTGIATEDPHWSSVKLLLNCNGANGSTTFTDSSPAARAVTSNGGASLSTTSQKYGSACGLFDGSNDYLSVADHADFQFGSGDFTVEFWFRPDAVPAAGQVAYLVGRYGSLRSWVVSLFNNAGDIQLNFICSVNGTTSLSAGGAGFNPTLGTWYFIQAVKSGTVTKVYANGVQHGSAGSVVGDLYVGSMPVSIGASGVPSGFYAGRFDDIRVTKGVARPVAVPTQELGRYSYSSRLNGRLRFTLASKRDGKLSHQAHDHTVLRPGYGFNYGELYGGV